MLDIGKDIHSLSDFKLNTTTFVDQMRDTGLPLFLTIDGEAEIVVQDAASYQKTLDRIDQFPDFDPRQHYALTVSPSEMTTAERAGTEAGSVDDVELDL